MSVGLFTDVFADAKRILGLGPFDCLPENNEELSPEQQEAFQEWLTEATGPQRESHIRNTT